MAILIAKPAGIPCDKDKIDGAIIYQKPVSLSYVYAKEGKLFHEKYKRFSECNWNKLKTLKKYPALIYINEDSKIKKHKKSSWCPLFLNRNLAVVAAGEVGSTRLDLSYLKFFAEKNLNPMLKKVPNLLFLESGKWMMERFIGFEAAMIVINSDGDIRIMNQKYGETVNKMWVFDSIVHSLQYHHSTSSSYGGHYLGC